MNEDIKDSEWDWFWSNYDRDDWECNRCGGEGFLELVDAPDLWGEDCLSEENRLVACPECEQIQLDIRKIILAHRKELKQSASKELVNEKKMD